VELLSQNLGQGYFFQVQESPRSDQRDSLNQSPPVSSEALLPVLKDEVISIFLVFQDTTIRGISHPVWFAGL
jgi:hypothetical protein